MNVANILNSIPKEVLNKFPEAVLQQAIEGLNALEAMGPEFLSRAISLGNELTAAHLDKKDITQNIEAQKKISRFHKEMFEHLNDQPIPSSSSKLSPTLAESERFERTFNRHLRLQSKISLRQSQQLLDNLTKDLEQGIEDIANKISLAEERGCHPVDLSSEAAAIKADQFMKELLIEEEEEKIKALNQQSSKKKNHKKKRGKVEKNKIAPETKAPASDETVNSNSTSSLDNQSSKANQKDEVSSGKKITISEISNTNSTSSLDSKLSKFVLELMQKSFKGLEHSRVQRWKTKNVELIRLFEDNVGGQKICRYKTLSDDQILEQRARHFLPGTERLLKDPSYRAIYTFPTDRGFGMVAQFTFNNVPHNGVLYFGIGQDKVIFHKYFENVKFQNSKKNVFRDEENTYLEEKETNEEESSDQSFNLNISNKGVLQFSYSNYDIRIFPIRKDLLSKKISRLAR